jgi:signal transduction histidine kinase
MGSDVTENFMLEKQLAAEQQLKQQEITAAVITAQENERTELATELHDNINQLLTTSRLYIECAIAEEHLRKQLLADSKTYLITAIAEIRKLSKTLLPPSLGEIGLQDALNDLVEGIQKIDKINIIMEWNNYMENIHSEKLKLSIYRIVQESLNNTIKHAAAANVYINVSQKKHSIILTFKDDGIGFNIHQKNDGVGLQNIAARAQLHNGEMQVKTLPGEGYNLVITFPF